MKPIGKAAPTDQDLRRVHDDGFTATELYLEEDHLRQPMDELIERLETAPVGIEAVHTPHSRTNDSEMFRRAAELARRLDALLIFHTAYMIEKTAMTTAADLEAPRIAFENQPGTSRRALEQLILEAGHELVLDVGHLFMASDAFLADLRTLADRATHIHLCDGTAQQDGLAFGDGDIDVGAVISAIAGSAYSGSVTLEVPVDTQADALRRFQDHGDTQ